jgi:hypothetical protein
MGYWWRRRGVGAGGPAYLDTLWLDTFPDATVTRLEDAGHYLQEDAHERIVPELVSFVTRGSA